MRRLTVLAVLGAIAVTAFGCGDSKSEPTNTPAQAGAELRQDHRQAARHHALAAAHRRAHTKARRERQAEERQVRHEESEADQIEEAPPEESSECDPNYACLNPAAYDYDCIGGSGDGPEYTGTVTVVGEDHYGLDSDSDGTGCED